MPVIASAGKQSSFRSAKHGIKPLVRIHSGLPRYARNDGGWLQGMAEMESQSA